MLASLGCKNIRIIQLEFVESVLLLQTKTQNIENDHL